METRKHKIDVENIYNAYRFFWGREPEWENVIQQHLASEYSIFDIIRTFLLSKESQHRNGKIHFFARETLTATYEPDFGKNNSPFFSKGRCGSSFRASYPSQEKYPEEKEQCTVSENIHVALLSKIRHIETTTLPRLEPRPDIAVIKVIRSGICGTDIKNFKSVNRRVAMPYGYEVSGIVIATEKNSILELRQRIAVDIVLGSACGTCFFCRQGMPRHCLSRVLPDSGEFAEYLLVKEEGVFPLPEGLNYALGALVEPVP